MTMPMLWLRQPDSIGSLGLAINACAERDGHPETVDRIADLLHAARDLWLLWPDLPEAEQLTTGRLVVRLVHLADIEATTAG